jgi:hypothetical protein
MASPNTLAARIPPVEHTCSGCAMPMPGPGRCAKCLARDRALSGVQPVSGTRHIRRRLTGQSRSKAGR